jgi:hypothetical protein
VKPPWGRITAIDLNTGEHVWMIANGDAPDYVKAHPAFAGVTLPRTGRPERSGLVVTRTLLFAGEGAGLHHLGERDRERGLAGRDVEDLERHVHVPQQSPRMAPGHRVIGAPTAFGDGLELDGDVHPHLGSPVTRHAVLGGGWVKSVGFCPSCGAKRAVIFSELLQNRILAHVAHAQ